MPERFSLDRTEAKLFASLALVLALVMGASYLLGPRIDNDKALISSRVVEESSFSNLTLNAKAVYVYDARSKDVLYAKNENIRLPLASLTKVMAALVALEQGSEESVIIITPQALKATGDNGLLVGEKWKLRDILDYSLVGSSNDGMRAVALSYGGLENFTREMNRKAAEIDMKNSYFWNATGLDETEGKGGAYGSATDISLLFDYIMSYYPELLEPTKEEILSMRSLSNFTHTIKNTNVIMGEIPGLKASKTGYTDVAGGNLVVAFDPELGRTIIISVLGSSEDGRFEDMKTLVSATLEHLSQNY